MFGPVGFLVYLVDAMVDPGGIMVDAKASLWTLGASPASRYMQWAYLST